VSNKLSWTYLLSRDGLKNIQREECVRERRTPSVFNAAHAKSKMLGLKQGRAAKALISKANIF
jgi:hypothetical protein